jgi:hypothetical protein
MSRYAWRKNDSPQASRAQTGAWLVWSALPRPLFQLRSSASKAARPGDSAVTGAAAVRSRPAAGAGAQPHSAASTARAAVAAR